MKYLIIAAVILAALTCLQSIGCILIFLVYQKRYGSQEDRSSDTAREADFSMEENEK